MKKIILGGVIIIVGLLMTSCLATYKFKVAVKVKDQTIMCKTAGENKVASLYCDFTIKTGPVVWNCHTLLKDLKKDWEPSVDAGCDVVVDLGKDIGDNPPKEN